MCIFAPKKKKSVSRPYYRAKDIILTQFCALARSSAANTPFNFHCPSLLCSLRCHSSLITIKLAVPPKTAVYFPFVQDLLTLALRKADQMNHCSLSFLLLFLLCFFCLTFSATYFFCCLLPLSIASHFLCISRRGDFAQSTYDLQWILPCVHPDLESENVIFSVYLIRPTESVCKRACEGSGFVFHHTSPPIIPKCNFLNLKRAGLAAHYPVLLLLLCSCYSFNIH